MHRLLAPNVIVLPRGSQNNMLTCFGRPEEEEVWATGQGVPLLAMHTPGAGSGLGSLPRGLPFLPHTGCETMDKPLKFSVPPSPPPSSGTTDGHSGSILPSC